MTFQRKSVRYLVEDRGYASPCWVWQLTKSLGYGKLHVDGHCRFAHRVFYEDHCGPIPDGYVIDHLCRQRDCVNPAHLEAVTQAENNRRSREAQPPKTHCRNGHEWAEENIRVDKQGRRQCRACEKARRKRTARAWAA